jgi:hypothetical protein
LCESQLWWRISGSFQQSEGRWKGERCIKLAEEKGWNFFARG